MAVSLQTLRMDFRLCLLDARQWHGEPQLTRVDPERVESRLAELPADRKQEASSMFVTILGLRDLEKTAARRLQMIDLMANKVLRGLHVRGESDLLHTMAENTLLLFRNKCSKSSKTPAKSRS